MARTCSLLLVASVWLGIENNPSVAGTSAGIRDADVAFGSLSEAREAVTRVLRASNRASGRQTKETTTALVSTYQQLARSENVPAGDRRRLQARLRARLSEQELALRRERETGTSLSGGVTSDAEMLLELIQTTIAPETWAINGGLGTIYYFPNR